MSAECEGCIEKSILILKPEAKLLTGNERMTLENSIKSHVPCACPTRYNLLLSHDQAADLWRNISEYPWFGKYCDLMSSGLVEVIYIRGSSIASLAKKQIRLDMKPAIERLTQEMNTGFVLDIVHGSDLQDINRELGVLGIKD